MAFTMNEMDIDDAARRNILGARILWAFKNMVNQRSDGWPYWNPPLRASAKLQELVQRGVTVAREGSSRFPTPVAPTPAEIAKALSPMKALCTRRSLPTDWLKAEYDEVAEANALIP